MFEYLNDPLVVSAIDSVAEGVYTDLQLIELYTEGSQGYVLPMRTTCPVKLC